MKKRGFTLIELLVVISIIAVLMAIMMPALGSARERGKRVICGNQLRSMASAINMYANENDGWLPLLGNEDFGISASKAEQYTWRTYVAYWQINNEDAPVGLGYLYDSGLIESPEIFYCTSSVDWKFEQYDGNNGKAWPSAFNTNENPPRVRTGYSYYPQHRKNREEINVFVIGEGSRAMSVPTLATKITQLNDSKSMVTDRLHMYDKVPHKIGKRRGVNAVYGDSSVSFVSNNEAFNEDLWHPGSSSNGPGNNNEIFKAVLANMDRSQ